MRNPLRIWYYIKTYYGYDYVKEVHSGDETVKRFLEVIE